MTIVDGPHHRGGVPWHEARVPRILHRCKTQTWGVYRLDPPPGAGPSGERLVERCACGAINVGGGWAERNATKLNHWKRKLGLR